MSEPVEKLTAAQRSKIRRLSAPKEIGPDEGGGELNIIPFLDIITNVLMFVLATVSTSFLTTIEVNAPKLGGGGGGARGPQAPSLGLNVLIVPDGLSLKGSGANIAPGCTGPGSGVTIPKIGKAYDFKSLAECAKKLKASNPEFADETEVRIGANSDVPYRTVIDTMDALRKDPADPKVTMFPEVYFIKGAR